MAKKNRTVNSYLKSARELKEFVPSLTKYRRRKTLTRWEKAAITRAERKVQAAGPIVPITKRQAKKLKDKSIIVGGGVRAIPATNTQGKTKVHVRNGEFTLETGGRTIEFFTVEPEPDILIERGFELLDNGYAELWLWLQQGRTNAGYIGKEPWARFIRNRFQQYKAVDQWVNGIAATRDPFKKS